MYHARSDTGDIPLSTSRLLNFQSTGAGEQIIRTIYAFWLHDLTTCLCLKMFYAFTYVCACVPLWHFAVKWHRWSNILSRSIQGNWNIHPIAEHLAISHFRSVRSTKRLLVDTRCIFTLFYYGIRLLSTVLHLHIWFVSYMKFCRHFENWIFLIFI